eukprot:scaffold12700_cov142-Skeletonema_menzelii.AAC.4
MKIIVVSLRQRSFNLMVASSWMSGGERYDVTSVTPEYRLLPYFFLLAISFSMHCVVDVVNEDSISM